MKMIVLPNGDAIRFDTVTAVIYLKACYFPPIGSLPASTYPDRVRIDHGERMSELIEFSDSESAISFRDKLIRQINGEEEDAIDKSDPRCYVCNNPVMPVDGRYARHYAHDDDKTYCSGSGKRIKE